MATRDRDRELLLPVVSRRNGRSKSSSPSSSSSFPRLTSVLAAWLLLKWSAVGRGCVILLPMAISFYITWGFIHFVDGFFSPIHNHLGINSFDLGFVTSIAFIFLVGVFMSSWLGALALTLGKLFIKKMPLVSYIYMASKQISAAISPGGMSIPQIPTAADARLIPAARMTDQTTLNV